VRWCGLVYFIGTVFGAALLSLRAALLSFGSALLAFGRAALLAWFGLASIAFF
jgi:hypothetical protein